MTNQCLEHLDRVCWPCQSVIAVFTRVGLGSPFWRELAWAHTVCVCVSRLQCAENELKGAQAPAQRAVP